MTLFNFFFQFVENECACFSWKSVWAFFYQHIKNVWMNHAYTLCLTSADITEREEQRCWKQQQWRLFSCHWEQRCWCCDICRSYLCIQQRHGFLLSLRLEFWRSWGSWGSHGRRTQRSRGAGAVCPHLQAAPHKAGIHPGKKKEGMFAW